MNGRIRRRALAAVGLLLCAAGPAPAAELTGRPPYSQFTPDIQVFPQNFAVAQDRDGHVYVGNAKGLLSFDGQRWKLIELPNHDIVRSLAFDGQQRVYVGGYDTFGYVEHDATGAEQYHDLTREFSALLAHEAFADIWNVHVAPQGVFFRALKHVFRYQPRSGAVQLWRHPGRFGAIVQQGRDVVLQFRGEGLKRLAGDGWELLPGSQPMSELVYELLHLPGGGLLAVAADGAWREYRDGAVRPFAMPQGFRASNGISDAHELADGSFALGTGDGELHFLDPASGHHQHFRIASTRIAGLVAAADGGLLCATSQALFHVEWPSAWSLLAGAEAGLSGNLVKLARWDERWLALTGAGVYEALDPGTAAQRFVRQPWSGHEAWDLLPLDARRALLAESYSLLLIEDGKAAPIGDATLYPRLLQPSRLHPGRIYVGTEHGLSVLRADAGGGFTLLLKDGDTPDALMWNLVETPDGHVWAGTERAGVFRLTLSADASRVEEVLSFGTAEGISYGRVPGANVAQLPDGSVVVATASGLYRWTGQRFEPTGLDGLAALLAKDELVSLRMAPNGDQWAWSYHHAYRRAAQGPWRRQEIGSILRGALQDASFDERGAALFGASDAVLRFDPALAGIESRAPEIQLRGVERLKPGGGRSALPLQPASAPELREGYGLSFWFALPELRRSGAARYQARLQGLSDQYSEWAEATSYSYLRLQPGRYRLQVRARDAQGRISEIQPYVFSVLPKWYHTAWARLLGMLAAAAALMLLVALAARRRTARLEAEKRRLEGMVAERTRELESANRQLHAIAHLDGLLEIPNRRRLDAYLEQVWNQCTEHQRPMSVLMMDVDRFKDYNDLHGHLAGDELLKEMVQNLSHCLRRSEDLVARYGGDEFVAVLPGAEPGAALEVAEAMRQRIEHTDIGATISIGVATRLPRRDQPMSDLIEAADGALYEAKRNGRNRVVSAAAP
ncbi:MAG TPA: diguanylate cyclase [Solimonas sp.]|nr:diguanylate cyclase [Solimonas sp.]